MVAVGGNGLVVIFRVRPLRRRLTKTVDSNLSKELIKGTIKEGDTVVLTASNGELAVKVGG